MRSRVAEDGGICRALRAVAHCGRVRRRFKALDGSETIAQFRDLCSNLGKIVYLFAKSLFTSHQRSPCCAERGHRCDKVISHRPSILGAIGQALPVALALQPRYAVSTPLSRSGRVYVCAVVAMALVPLSWAVRTLIAAPPPATWYLLSSVALITAPFSIRIPSLKTRISLCEAFVFAAALLFGPAAATLTAVIDGVMVAAWSRHRTL